MRSKRGVYSGMFEQSVLINPKRNPWSMALSLTLQCSFVGAALLVSVLHIERLNVDLLKPPPIRVPFNKPIDAVELVPTPHSGTSRSTNPFAQPRPFTMPTKIPTEINMIDDIGSAPPALGNSDMRSGVPGAPILMDGVIGGSSVPAPPPPPPQHNVTVTPAVPKPPMQVTSKLAEAMLVHRVIPPYPPLAKQMRISGRVRLTGVISASGTIEKLEVIDGHPMLVKAAVDAVKQWVYRPTVLNGQAIPVVAPIEVNFILN